MAKFQRGFLRGLLDACHTDMTDQGKVTAQAAQPLSW